MVGGNDRQVYEQHGLLRRSCGNKVSTSEPNRKDCEPVALDRRDVWAQQLFLDNDPRERNPNLVLVLPEHGNPFVRE